MTGGFSCFVIPDLIRDPRRQRGYGSRIKSGESRASTEDDEGGRRSGSGRAAAQRPAAMFDMGGLADDAFGQDDLAHRPADRRHFLSVQPVAAIVDRDVRFGGGAVHDRRLFAQQMIDQRLLERPRLGQGPSRPQRHRLAVLDPVETEREGCRGEAVERGDGRGQPLGRRIVKVVERDERDMEKVGAAPGIVARQRGDRRLHLRRRLGHDVEGVSGAHGWECSMVWGRGRLAAQT